MIRILSADIGGRTAGSPISSIPKGGICRS
jgi:hypothetical protein